MSKPSRWAVNDDSGAAAAAERKREKEEKRRLKEEKARKLATSTAPLSKPDSTTFDDERPHKRRRTSPLDPDQEPDASQAVSNEDTNILSFPNPGFGPSASVAAYTILNPIEEGSYGHVSRARANSTGDIVALKKLKMDNSEGFPVTALREIQTLKACSHPYVINLREVVVGNSFSE